MGVSNPGVLKIFCVDYSRMRSEDPTNSAEFPCLNAFNGKIKVITVKLLFRIRVTKFRSIFCVAKNHTAVCVFSWFDEQSVDVSSHPKPVWDFVAVRQWIES